MPLENAFGELALDATLQQLVTRAEELGTEETLQDLADLLVDLIPISGNDLDNSPTGVILGSNQVWEGTWKDIEHFGNMIFLYATSETAPTSVQMQWSDDASTVIATSTLTAQTAKSGGLTYQVYISLNNGNYQGKYARPKVTNSATAHTLPSIFFSVRNHYPFAGTFLGLDAQLTLLSRALLTRSVQAGSDPDGNFVNLAQGGTKTLDPAPEVLGASGVYTSQWMDTEQYPSVRLLITSDVPSVENGITFQWSDTPTGVVIRTAESRTFRQAYVVDGRLILTTTRARYLRIVYTNGLTPQTRFFLNLRLSPFPVVQTVALESTSQGRTYQQTVSLVATALPTPLAGRKTLRLKNLSSSARALFFGFTSGVTVETGDELAAGESIDLDIDEQVSVYVLTTSTGGAGVRCAGTEIA